MTLNPAFLSNLVLISTALAGAFLAALWLSLVFWTFRDARKRIRYWPVQVLATVVSAVLFIPGIIIYLVLRPAVTLEEEYQQALEEEALLHSIETKTLCPGCSRKIEPDWIACPTCHTRLRRACPQCGQAIELSWDLCPYCTTPINQSVVQPIPAPLPAGGEPPEKSAFL
ncbi:MAG: zinc ribbon domain-containing protein [Anaerolineae bacterium]|nr:zinc ribbon domain-containing protein [Anaerolineae bacterium]